MPQQSLGEYLRECRQKSGISLEQIAKDTKIRSSLLIALEENRFSDIPQGPFLRGFIRAYCKCIGLDAEELFYQFESIIKPMEETVTADRISLEGGGYTHERAKRDGMFISLWLIIAVVLLAGITFLLLNATTVRNYIPFFSEGQKRWQSERKLENDKRDTVIREVENKESEITPIAEKEPPVEALTSQKNTAVKEDFETVQVAKIQDSTENRDNGSEEMQREKENGEDNTIKQNNLSLQNDEAKQPQNASETSPKELVEPMRKAASRDPLLKGDMLRGDEIFVKLVFKALDNTTLSYRVDENQPMTYRLLKGKIIVLRARNNICFQVERTSLLLVRVDKNRIYTPLSQFTFLTRQGKGGAGCYPVQDKAWPMIDSVSP